MIKQMCVLVHDHHIAGSAKPRILAFDSPGWSACFAPAQRLFPRHGLPPGSVIILINHN